MFLSIYILHYRLETHITTRYVPSRACSGLYDQILDLGAQNGWGCPFPDVCVENVTENLGLKIAWPHQTLLHFCATRTVHSTILVKNTWLGLSSGLKTFPLLDWRIFYIAAWITQKCDFGDNLYFLIRAARDFFMVCFMPLEIFQNHIINAHKMEKNYCKICFSNFFAH